MKAFIALLLVFSLCTGSVFARQENGQNLPPGLQMKVDRGGKLPPGWERKLITGEVLEESLYRNSEIVIPVDDNGLLTVRIEGKLVRLVEATREIIGIVDMLN